MFKGTPPMGWNSWNTFGENISEDLIFQIADTMVESGLAEHGYDYLIIDDCWGMPDRDENGCLQYNKDKFPNGMKAVADYIHAKGLKFGMYSCTGNITCIARAGSFGHEFQDAKTFAEWEIDYLKHDCCYKPYYQPGHLLYKRMGAAIANCGREILFHACNGGLEDAKEWIKSTGANMWRSTGDINDSWQSIKDIAFQQFDVQAYNGLNCYNDMDMLVVGMNGMGNVGLTGCTKEEYKTHFSLWAMLNSPLIIGCDIRCMSDDTKEILMNTEIININQDVAGRQPFFLNDNRDTVILAKLLNNGDFAVGLFNFSDSDVTMFLHWADLGIDRILGKGFALRDLWSHEDIGVSGDMYRSPVICAHGCQMLRASLVDVI